MYNHAMVRPSAHVLRLLLCCSIRLLVSSISLLLGCGCNCRHSCFMNTEHAKGLLLGLSASGRVQAVHAPSYNKKLLNASKRSGLMCTGMCMRNQHILNSLLLPSTARGTPQSQWGGANEYQQLTEVWIPAPVQTGDIRSSVTSKGPEQLQRGRCAPTLHAILPEEVN